MPHFHHLLVELCVSPLLGVQAFIRSAAALKGTPLAPTSLFGPNGKTYSDAQARLWIEEM